MQLIRKSVLSVKCGQVQASKLKTDFLVSLENTSLLFTLSITSFTCILGFLFREKVSFLCLFFADKNDDLFYGWIKQSEEAGARDPRMNVVNIIQLVVSN